MTVLKCEVCRSYYHDVDDHSCPGLRSVDWALFVRALREWMASDPYAQFEVFYARRREAARDVWPRTQRAHPAPAASSWMSVSSRAFRGEPRSSAAPARGTA